MLDREYDNQVCSIARSLEVVGERWSLLIIRNIGLGLNRFEPLRENLGITRSVLTTRLNTLIDYGILEKRQYSERPPRFEYHLTEKGRDLAPVLLQLMWWGDQYYPESVRAPDHRGPQDLRRPSSTTTWSARSAANQSNRTASTSKPAPAASQKTSPKSPPSPGGHAAEPGVRPREAANTSVGIQPPSA